MNRDDDRRPEPAPRPVPPGLSRLSRRQFLYTAGAGGAAITFGGLAAGCSTSSSPGGSGGAPGGARIPHASVIPGPPPVSGGRYGGKLNVVYNDQPAPNFDPQVAYSVSAYDVASEMITSGALLGYSGQHGGPIANLAASMPTISPDGKTLTFTLRPGIKFHNGREIVASDFKWSWERMLRPSIGSWGPNYINSVVGWDAVVSGKTKTLEGVDAVNDRTLVVHLVRPDFTFLNAMCLPITAPVPQEEVARLGSAWGNTPVGYGPFKITAYNAASQTATFERFDDYFWKGLPYLDEIQIRWGVAPQTEVLDIEHGDADLAGDGVAATLLASVTTNPALRGLMDRFTIASGRWIYLFPSFAPFRSQLVRQAMNWAVNRDAVVRISHGAARPMGTPFPEGVFNGLATEFTPYGYDPAKAKSLLKQAGYPHGFNVTLTYPNYDIYPVLAQILQQQYGAVGIKISLNQVSESALLSLEAKAGALQMSMDQLIWVQPSPADNVNYSIVTGGSGNFTGYRNAQVNKLALQARGTYNTAQQDHYYGQLYKLVAEDAPWVWLENYDFVGLHTQRVMNYKYRAELGNYYDRLWVSS